MPLHECFLAHFPDYLLIAGDDDRLLDAGPLPEETADLLTEVLRLRLAGGELALRAANAAMLHQGARGTCARPPPSAGCAKPVSSPSSPRR